MLTFIKTGFYGAVFTAPSFLGGEHMIRATTPTHVFTFPNDIDPSECKRILITYKQGNKIIFEVTEENVTIDGQDVLYTLTQEETNKFKDTVKANVQVRILLGSDEALASDILSFIVKPVLDDEILT